MNYAACRIRSFCCFHNTVKFYAVKLFLSQYSLAYHLIYNKFAGIYKTEHMQHITVEELKSRLDAGEKLHIIDVREPEEYAEVNLGVQLIPLGNIMGMQLDPIEQFKDEELIVHCRSGKRSMQACMVLEQAGFTHTVNVTGGIMAWLEKYGNEKIN
jgi:rhodanese-related sulfurtransferase